jgi:hypothetical protein
MIPKPLIIQGPGTVWSDVKTLAPFLPTLSYLARNPVTVANYSIALLFLAKCGSLQ